MSNPVHIPSYLSRLSGDRHRADSLNRFILSLQGNHYCSRDYGNGSNSYHYSNQYVSLSSVGSRTRLIHMYRDGSYYYANPNGSTYYNDGKGEAKYTPPSDGGKK